MQKHVRFANPIDISSRLFFAKAFSWNRQGCILQAEISMSHLGLLKITHYPTFVPEIYNESSAFAFNE